MEEENKAEIPSLRDSLAENYNTANEEYKEDGGQRHESETSDVKTQDEEMVESKVSETNIPVEVNEEDSAEDIESTDSDSETSDSENKEVSEESEGYKIDPPASWTKEEKETFNAIPDEIIIDDEGNEHDLAEMKRLVADYSKNLQSGFDKKFQANADALKEYEAISGVFDDQYSAFLTQNGISRPQATAMFIQTHRSLLEDPAGTIKHLMSTYGVQPNQVGAASNEDFEDDWDDAMPEDKNRMRGDVYDDLIAKINRLEQKETYNQQAELQSKVDGFVNATDEGGNKVHKHFDDVVEREMSVLLQTGQATTLEEAYAQSPTVINRSTKEDVERAKREEAKAKRLKVAQAKKSSKSLSNGVVGDTRPKDIDLRTELSRVMNGSNNI